MTQIGTILEALLTIALTWGLPVLAGLLAYASWQRSKVRYHVGCTSKRVPVETYRTRSAAVRASMRLYREHGRAFRISKTR